MKWNEQDLKKAINGLERRGPACRKLARKLRNPGAIVNRNELMEAYDEMKRAIEEVQHEIEKEIT